MSLQTGGVVNAVVGRSPNIDKRLVHREVFAKRRHTVPFGMVDIILCLGSVL